MFAGVLVQLNKARITSSKKQGADNTPCFRFYLCLSKKSQSSRKSSIALSLEPLPPPNNSLNGRIKMYNGNNNIFQDT